MKNYKISIKSPKDGKKEINLTLDDLKKFPKHTVTASLMCAGNRRSQMNTVIYFFKKKLFMHTQFNMKDKNVLSFLYNI